MIAGEPLGLDPVARWGPTRRALGWLVVAADTALAAVVGVNALGFFVGTGALPRWIMDGFGFLAWVAAAPMVVATWKLAATRAWATRLARIVVVVGFVARSASAVMGLVHSRLELLADSYGAKELLAFRVVQGGLGLVALAAGYLALFTLALALRRIAGLAQRPFVRKLASVYVWVVALTVVSYVVQRTVPWDLDSEADIDRYLTALYISLVVEIVLYHGGFLLLVAKLRAALPRETTLTRSFE